MSTTDLLEQVAAASYGGYVLIRRGRRHGRETWKVNVRANGQDELTTTDAATLASALQRALERLVTERRRVGRQDEGPGR